MADQLGRAITYSTPVTADHREILGAWYAFINAGSDPNWEIKAGVTIPAQIAQPGDAGFIITDTATGNIDIAIADHAGVGGAMADGSAIGSGDDVLIGVDPSGGITDITPGGWTVGARWSGWTPNGEGPSYPIHTGRSKTSSGADWLFGRFKDTSNLYSGGFFVGRYTRQDAGIGDGFVLASGLWTDLNATGANDHCYVEVDDGVWEPARFFPSDVSGLTANYASDGAGAFRTVPVMVYVPNGAIASSVAGWSPVGVVPALFASANGTLAKRWDDSTPATVGYNIDGGCWIARDDGTDAE